MGDPIRPAPQYVDPPQLGGGSIRLLGYPLPMVLAENIVTAVQRGQANARWRDFADLYVLTTRHCLDSTELAETIGTVASSRRVNLRSLSALLDRFALYDQPRWVAWRRKQQLQDRLPEDCQTVLDHVTSLADPCLEGRTCNGRWVPDLSHTCGTWKS